MPHSLLALRAKAQQLLLLLYKRVAVAQPHRPGIFLALVVIGVVRLLPASYLQTLDSLLGRPGDAMLLLALSLLVVLLVWITPNGVVHSGQVSAQVEIKQSSTPVPLTALLENHLQLDQAIDNKLNEIVIDTESSALAIIGEVRKLYDTANQLVVYLDSSSAQTNELGADILGSLTSLVELGEFIKNLPATMEHELQSVQRIVKEIEELSGLVGSVHAISMQSHLLAINAAIEGSRAGPSGAAFRIVAAEMRLLAKNSSGVADKINQGLVRARAVVEGSMSASIDQSSQRLQQVSLAGESIQKMHDNFEDMNQFFKTRFAVVTKHSEDLAGDISEVLGHIQYQDVVSQCVGRLRLAIGQRNAFFQSVVDQVGQESADLSQLPDQLALILNNYVTEEAKHRHSARQDTDDGTELKFELF